MYNSVYFFLIIIYLKIIFGKLLGPTDLARTQILFIYKMPEIIMIDKDEKFVLVTF